MGGSRSSILIPPCRSCKASGDDLCSPSKRRSSRARHKANMATDLPGRSSIVWPQNDWVVCDERAACAPALYILARPSTSILNFCALSKIYRANRSDGGATTSQSPSPLSFLWRSPMLRSIDRSDTKSCSYSHLADCVRRGARPKPQVDFRCGAAAAVLYHINSVVVFLSSTTKNASSNRRGSAILTLLSVWV